MKPRPIAIDIDELALFGFDRRQAAQLGDEIRRALSQALAEQGPPSAWTAANQRHVARLDVPIRATDSPAAIAERLAARVCKDNNRGGQR